ncbi:isoprenylcysteine carboxylmethyltransferase family protein [Candidatus Bathyarchaeota archaeon]|nr:isoprenylcysteine carboxylmethyltransferase family protein [Candidatus Bathyarchaeota archaeon]
MSWLMFNLTGFLLVLPVYFVSVEHVMLMERFGDTRGERVGDFLGYISGWGMFLFMIGMWVSPQRVFRYPFQGFYFVALGIQLVSALIGLLGLKELGLAVSETHRPEMVVTSGVYSFVMHPQYLAAIIAHIGFSFERVALDSLLLTPLVVTIIYIICRKEEVELVREFGDEYKRYQKRVPMFFSGLRR